jgi:hypothetical protein
MPIVSIVRCLPRATRGKFGESMDDIEPRPRPHLAAPSSSRPVVHIPLTDVFPCWSLIGPSFERLGFVPLARDRAVGPVHPTICPPRMRMLALSRWT